MTLGYLFQPSFSPELCSQKCCWWHTMLLHGHTASVTRTTNPQGEGTSPTISWKGTVKGKGSLPSYLRCRSSCVPIGKALSQQLCSANGNTTSLLLIRACSRALWYCPSRPGLWPLAYRWHGLTGSESTSPQRSLPPKTSARLVWACPLASTGSASAASGWLDSPHYPTGQSGRSKGTFSYQLEQV